MVHIIQIKVCTNIFHNYLQELLPGICHTTCGTKTIRKTCNQYNEEKTNRKTGKILLSNSSTWQKISVPAPPLHLSNLPRWEEEWPWLDSGQQTIKTSFSGLQLHNHIYIHYKCTSKGYINHLIINLDNRTLFKSSLPQIRWWADSWCCDQNKSS